MSESRPILYSALHAVRAKKEGFLPFTVESRTVLTRGRCRSLFHLGCVIDPSTTAVERRGMYSCWRTRSTIITSQSSTSVAKRSSSKLHRRRYHFLSLSSADRRRPSRDSQMVIQFNNHASYRIRCAKRKDPPVFISLVFDETRVGESVLFAHDQRVQPLIT